MLNTTDGGNTWTSQNSGSTQSLFGVSFSDANDAVAVGDGGTILRTTNGGTAWISLAGVTFDRLEDVFFLDPLNGWIVGENGAVLRTIDGGINWSVLSSGTALPLRSVHFTDSNHGVAVGGVSLRQSPYAGIILKTTDGGTTWESETGTDASLTDVSFFDSNTGIAIGYDYWGGGPTLRTTNGGRNWTVQGFLLNGYLTGNDIECIDATNAYMVSHNGIRKTTDAGLSWIDNTIDSVAIQGIYFSDADIGTMVGYYSPGGVCGTGAILRTTDGGNTWNHQTSPTELPLTDVCFTDNDHGWIVGSTSVCAVHDGILLGTTNGGETWMEQWSSPGIPLLDICFTDANNGWAVGTTWFYPPYDSSIILHTTDGGDNWIETTGINGLRSIFFTDVNNGWIVGCGGDTLGSYFGKILHTNDGGVTWTQQESGTTAFLSTVHFIDANTGWIVGNGGTILHTTNGGLTFVEGERPSEAPTDYSLLQNYPNPFNPSTRIVYGVPSREFVELCVYDVLGRKVAMLVNEVKSPGTYTVEFDGSGLASGVYVYKLNAGDFIAARKLVLIK